MARSPSLELNDAELKEVHEYLQSLIEDKVYTAEIHLTRDLWFKLHRTGAISVFKTGHTQEVFQSILDFENYFKIL